MAVTASGISGVASSIGGAVGAFFGSDGSGAAASSYFKSAAHYADARDIALKNKLISEESTAIQLAQTDRKIHMGIGAQEASIAGAGVTGGSAGDLLRMAMQQGGLAKAVVGQQGSINANAYEQQAEGYDAQKESMIGAGVAAQHAAAAQNASGFMQLLGGGIKLAGMFL